MSELVKFGALMTKEFIMKFPMATLLILIVPTYVPLLPDIFMGNGIFALDLNLAVLKFKYAGIPLGLTLMWALYLPVYYFYIRPTWARLDKEATEAIRNLKK